MLSGLLAAPSLYKGRMGKTRFKNCRIIVHIGCILAAVLISGIAEAAMEHCMMDGVPSTYYDDLKMSEQSSSILGKVSMYTVNSRLDDLSVYAEKEDARLILEFPEEEAVTPHSIELLLAESFPYDIECVFYYPNPMDKYVEECKDTFILPEGKKKIYFEIPDDVQYPMAQLRVDIDEDYTIEDILISEEKLVGYYLISGYFSEHSDIIYFLLLFLSFELLIHFGKNIFRFIRNYLGLFLFLLGSGAVGNVAMYIIFRFAGRDFSWFWSELLFFCSMIIAYLLFRKGTGRRNAGIHNSAMKRGVYWSSILILCLLIAFMWFEGMNAAPELSEIIRLQFPFVFAIVEMVLLALLYQKYIMNVRESEIPFSKIYLFLILLFGTAYLLVFLPYISPDEPTHYLSAYRVSNLFLGKIGRWDNERLLMRIEDYHFYDLQQRVLNAEYYKKITENTRLFASDSGFMMADGPMLTNAVFSYFAAGVGITAARVLHLSASMTFLAGRFANLIFYLLVLRHLMKKIPFGKTALYAVSMLPMMLHMIASYSYDVMTFCFVALFVVQVMCMVCSPERISRRDYFLCIVYGMLMAPSKMVYIPLLFLVLMIPGEKLDTENGRARMKKMGMIGICIASTLAIILIVNSLSADSAIREMMEEDATVNMLTWIHEPGYTISWILNHFGEYILMCVRTVIKYTDYYFFTMVGDALGWLDISVPRVYVMISFIYFLLGVNSRTDGFDWPLINSSKKLWIVLLCMGSAFLTILVMALNWTPMSYNFISGVQGRYFLPLMIPMAWVLRGRMVEVSGGVRKHMICYSTMINVWILVYIFSMRIVRT